MARSSRPREDAQPSATDLRSWGLDPAWSRQVTFSVRPDSDPVTWHVLDTGEPKDGDGPTLVCVHGNPSWSYLWRDVLSTLGRRYRVVAVDQTGMGFSERTAPRRLAERVEELVAFCRAETTGPLVLIAHDWGGPVAVGASASLPVVAMVLSNTAVAKPADVAVPPLIASARRFVDLSCRRTTAFVAGAAAMTQRSHRAALLAPYRSTRRRQAIGDFVADIPVFPGDPSAAALASSAAALATFAGPVLLVWGGRDPVFHDRFLRDLRQRVPGADVHYEPSASHFLPLDVPIGSLVGAWLENTDVTEAAGDRDGASVAIGSAHPVEPADLAPSDGASLLADLDRRHDDHGFVYRGPDGDLTWSDLHTKSLLAARVLAAHGVAAGDRVALLVPPGADLLVASCALWRVGAVPVVAEASAGLRPLRRLLRAAAARHVVAPRRILTAAVAGRMTPGAQRFTWGRFPRSIDFDRPVPASTTMDFPSPDPDDLAAIVHTSGATGPAKPVCYTHGALLAQRGVMRAMVGQGEDEAFTTSFGAFMLLAPALGLVGVRPDFDVNHASELDFDTLAGALGLASVTTAWLSPASARSIVATAGGRRLGLPVTLLAGAPIPASLASAVAAVTGGEVRAPYGMTEALPLTDGINPEATGPFGGTATGAPLPGVAVVIERLSAPGEWVADDEDWGEILVSAPWMFAGYDSRWQQNTEHRVVIDGRRFHRTGDVGYRHDGQLFQLGRRTHVIETPLGLRSPVALEQPVETALGTPVAFVGVGPKGAQVLVCVLEDSGDLRLADDETAHQVRSVGSEPVAAVLRGSLPTDRRHESKVDRVALADAVSDFLAGR